MNKIISLSDSGLEFAVSSAARILKEGGVVAVPTDTLYGLVCTLDNTNKLYEIKKRSYSKPCALFVADITNIKKWCYTSLDHYIFKRLLPGPVTLLFQRSRALPQDFNPGYNSVGIRIPNSQFIRVLSSRMSDNGPLVQTSANLSESTSPVCVEDFRDLWDQIDLIIDGGHILDRDGNAFRKGSTIVNLSIPGTYSIIRDGCARVQTEEKLRDCGLVAITDGDLVP